VPSFSRVRTECLKNIMMKKAVIRTMMTGVYVCVIVLLAGSCGESPAGTEKSAVYLTVEDAEDAYGMYIDVYDDSLPGGVGDDKFQVNILSHFKNPTFIDPQGYYDVTIQEYQVSYYRPDGKGPVPASYFVQLNGQVPSGSQGMLELLVFRQDAKLRSPCKELVLGGGDGYIDMNVIIHFYGEDRLGNNVSARYVLFVVVTDVI
jgi:hypothetical protein